MVKMEAQDNQVDSVVNQAYIATIVDVNDEAWFIDSGTTNYVTSYSNILDYKCKGKLTISNDFQ